MSFAINMETSQHIKETAESYSQTEQGSWLNDFDWDSVPVTFKKSLPFDIVGTHSFGRITLLDCPDYKQIFPVYIHELRHVWQSKKHPAKYLIGKLYRPLIENDADAEELKAEEFIQKS